MNDHPEGLHDGRDKHEVSKDEMKVEFLDRREGEDVVDFAKRVALAVSREGVFCHIQNPDNLGQVIIVITSLNQPQDPPRGWTPSQNTINAIQQGLRIDD